jgi:hypothetical protein
MALSMYVHCYKRMGKDCGVDMMSQVARRKMDMLFVRGDGVILVS